MPSATRLPHSTTDIGFAKIRDLRLLNLRSRRLKGVIPMYAIISDSGRQYTVREGDVLVVDYREAEKGSTIDFDNVLAVSGDAGLTVGTPTVSGAKVSAEVIGPKLGKKLVVQKFRRRKNSRRKTGHRQMHLEVKIGKISS